MRFRPKAQVEDHPRSDLPCGNTAAASYGQMYPVCLDSLAVPGASEVPSRMRVLIVGLGVMGRHHQRVLRWLRHETVTVDPRGHADFKSITGAWSSFDAAVIATPPQHLANGAIAVIRRGVPVLVEKPCGAQPSDVRRIDAVAREHDVYVTADYTERHNPVVPALRAALTAAGGAQLLHTARVGPARLDASIETDLLCHDIDLHLELCPQARHVPVVAYHDHKLRTFTAHCPAGIVQADLIARTVNGKQCLGPEPLASVWQAFEARRRCGYEPLDREVAVLERALQHQAIEAAA